MKTFSTLFLLLALAAGLVTQSANAVPPVKYVKASATGSGDGSSWANAYNDLQSALTALNSGGTIWIAAGTYKPGGGTPLRVSTFSLPNNIVIYGGFAGTESSVADRDIASNVTILSGDIGTAGDSTDNTYNVVTIPGISTLDGVTITGGNANRGWGNQFDLGGAVTILQSGALTLKNSILTRNYASAQGGAIANMGTSALITNCLFYANKSGSYGGAVSANGNTTIITNCTFSGNSANSQGGALCVFNGATNIVQNSILYSNSPANIYNGVGTILVINYSCCPGYTGLGATTSNCYELDPSFVGSGDYCIQFGSPYKEMGNDSYNTESFDIRGWKYPRKIGTHIDMGAYEYNANPLPVELTSFTAEIAEKSVELKWRTATEVNNYGFEIERAMDNETSSSLVSARDDNWSKIGFVEGNGTTNAPKSYSFTDKSASGKISYRLKQIDRDGKFEYSQTVEVTAAIAPKEFSLEQNYPNPFNPTTSISYQLSANSFTTLKIYDAIGREVATLVNDVKEAGTYSAQFDGAKLSSGIYFANLTSSGKTQMRKLVLMK